MKTQKNTTIKAIALTLAAMIFALLQSSGTAKANVNSSIVNYCKHYMGKKIGRGECTDLAEYAFRYAHALRFGPSGPDVDYVWGRQIYSIRISNGLQIEDSVSWTHVKPGDIIQFRDAYFQGRKSNGGSYWKSAHHHTAVVLAVHNGGKKIYVYEQNTNNKRYVIAGLYNLNDLQKGWLKIYRPFGIPQVKVPKIHF